MIKAIVFDLGGVLYHAVFNDIKIFQNFIKEWDKVKTGGMTDQEFYEIIATSTNTTPKKIREKFLSGIAIDEDMRNLVIALKQNYKIGILTNTIEDLYEADKSIWNFEELAEVITSFNEHVAKPGQEAMDLMLQKLGVEKEEIIFIDDHPDTIKRYSQLGITCIKFTGYKNLLNKLQKMEIQI